MRATLGLSRVPRAHHSTSVSAPHSTLEGPTWRQGPVCDMKSSLEGTTASRMSQRRSRGPCRFLVASLAIYILRGNCFIFPLHTFITFIHSLHLFSGRLQPHKLPDIALSAVCQRGLPAGGAHWPNGPTGLKVGAIGPVPPGYVPRFA